MALQTIPPKLIVLVLVSLISKSMSSIYIYKHFSRDATVMLFLFLATTKAWEALFSWRFICTHLLLPSFAQNFFFCPCYWCNDLIHMTPIFSILWRRALMLVDKWVQSCMAFALSRSSLESYSCEREEGLGSLDGSSMILSFPLPLLAVEICLRL